MNDKLQRLELVRSAWDAYHPDYMGFQLRENPHFHKDFADGAVMLDAKVTGLAGAISGQKLLDICCACDATQAFSWANLGAEVTACDMVTYCLEDIDGRIVPARSYHDLAPDYREFDGTNVAWGLGPNQVNRRVPPHDRRDHERRPGCGLPASEGRGATVGD